jgi:hypothetical protein
MRNYIIVGVSCLLIGRFVLQPKPRIETKEVIKFVEKKEEVKNTKKKTVVKEIITPDGGVSTEIVIVEDSSSETKESVNSETKVDFKQKRGIIVGVSALKDLGAFQENPAFGANIAVPVMGSLLITGSVDTTKRVGIGIALEF